MRLWPRQIEAGGPSISLRSVSGPAGLSSALLNSGQKNAGYGIESMRLISTRLTRD